MPSTSTSTSTRKKPTTSLMEDPVIYGSRDELLSADPLDEWYLS